MGKRLILFDALAIAYRAFYGVSGLATKAGVPTNAVYGFIRMVGQLLEAAQATHWAVVFDGGVPQARLDLVAEYKAQRPPMPDALRSQLPLIEEYLDCAALPWARVAGEEADDVLASVARWAAPECELVALATQDKDLFQLVDERIKVLTPGKLEWLDVAGVQGKTGVTPDRIVPWLALVGDSSDNIGGVPGVGGKTAAKLLNQFGSLEGVWANLATVSGDKVRQSLDAHRALVERNLAMVRLRQDLACPFDWARLARTKGDAGRLLAFFERMEFKSLAREISEPTLF